MTSIHFASQHEDNDCGLACIFMIASYYGLFPDKEAIRNKFRPPLGGMTFTDLANAVSSIDLKMHTFYCSLEELLEIKPPVMVHWRASHFVVLAKRYYAKGSLLILDPNRGSRNMSETALAARFTGFAATFKPITLE